jgi:hypothetical protein
MRAGQPAHALALELYLHWLDAEEGRTEAADLLAAALRAIGAAPLSEILDLHIRYFRDVDPKRRERRRLAWFPSHPHC